MIYTGILILTLILFSFFAPYFVLEEKIDPTAFEKEIAQLRRLDSSTKKVYVKTRDNEYLNEYPNEYPNEYTRAVSGKTDQEQLFQFDPNTATIQDWTRLGVRQRTAETIHKYVAKGGKFHQPDDLKKIWGLHEADFNRLRPYINIKAQESDHPKPEKIEYSGKSYSYAPRVIPKVDINLADTTAYIALPGIGSKLAKRIISFRDKLGGFHSVSQVGETFLLPDSTFQKIKPYLEINNPLVKKINVNTASIDEMKAHPYIRYHIANAIFQYRQQHSSFRTIKDIQKILIITEDTYSKIAPYLTVE